MAFNWRGVRGGTVVGYRLAEDTTNFVVDRFDVRVVQRDDEQVVTSEYSFASDTDANEWYRSVVMRGGTVSETRLSLVNTLIDGLKTDGIWTKLDRLWIFAAENAISALTDVVSREVATIGGSPSFSADDGYTGTDSANPSNYINLGYNPSTGTNFSLNSGHISAWSTTNVAASNGGCLAGCNTGSSDNVEIYVTFTDGNIYGRINDAAGDSGAPGTRQGHWIVSRTGASAKVIYQNGSTFATPNTASSAVPNLIAYALATDGIGDAKQGTPNQIAMVSFGGGLNSTEADAFYDRLRTYMTAVGVP